jgi:hypothetical protein
MKNQYFKIKKTKNLKNNNPFEEYIIESVHSLNEKCFSKFYTRKNQIKYRSVIESSVTSSSNPRKFKTTA